MKKVWRILSYVLVAVAASAATMFAFGGTESTEAAGQTKLEQLADLIEERFIGEADRTEFEDAAADAMVEALGDRWSYYIPADEYQAHVEQMKNSYVGVGITIAVMEDGSGYEVIKVNAGGPADEAGMLPGDVIIAVDGVSVAGMTTSEGKTMVQGEENTRVVLTVRRGEETLDLDVTRKQVDVEVATAEMLEDQIGLVTIMNFDERCADETIAAIEALLDQGAEALIFDVRYNPGGYKHELVKVLDYLLPEGPLFRSEDYKGNVSVDESDAACLEIPMVVLVNGDSYSAAEFFAAALREYGVAVIVGEQTCGKGYFQQTYQLLDGSAVGLSVGRYTTPNGVSLADVGITPDVIVEIDEETAFGIYADTLPAAEDPQIQAAVAALTGE